MRCILACGNAAGKGHQKTKPQRGGVKCAIIIPIGYVAPLALYGLWLVNPVALPQAGLHCTFGACGSQILKGRFLGVIVMLNNNSLFIFFAVLIFSLGICGQNRFEGYSVVVEANNAGACPVWYLPAANSGNAIDVFVAGTGQQTAVTNLTACNDSFLRNGNTVFPNTNGLWCFHGPEPFYEVKFRNGNIYLWYPKNDDSGFYNVKDFRPVKRNEGGSPQYVFTDPPDWTSTIRNAIAVIAARQGGTLRFPDGDYIVGTLDGNRRDPKYEAITLPSGIVIEGASSNISVPTANAPLKQSASRIRLRNPNQAIFRIGGCTNQVVVRQVELLGNSELFGEAKRDTTGTYGIEGLGKWQLTPNEAPNTSQGIRVENVTFQNFDKGFFVHNANDGNCNSREQYCGAWQFDYVLVDHGMFINNRTGIWIDTFDTDWKITNSFFSFMASNAPGDGIRLQKAGAVLIEQVHAGGYNYGSHIGGTFLHIDTAPSVTVISTAAERLQRAIYTNPAGSITSSMLTVIGSVFGDKIDLNGRLNFISTGNAYGARTIDAEPTVTITSVGDRYCYDSMVLPGRCTDTSGRTVQNPGIISGRKMFESGSVGEDTGPNRIDGRPNFFGYNVRIGDGLLQFDPNITFKDIQAWATGSGTRPKAEDGAFVYCKDCRKNNLGLCSQGISGTDGTFAKRINGQWRCD